MLSRSFVWGKGFADFWQFLFSAFAKEQLLHTLGGACATRSQACEGGAATAASGAGTLQRRTEST